METLRTYTFVSMLAAGSIALTGCNSSSDTTDSTANTPLETQTLAGTVIKGPIDGATVTIKNDAGQVLQSAVSRQGSFHLSLSNPTGRYFTIETSGGRYSDEATEQNVTIPDNQGLRTLLTASELQELLDQNGIIAVTPETTIYATISEYLMQQGKTPQEAEAEAKRIITEAMIDGTSPLSALPGDAFLNEGNLTTPFPKDQTEAFARNRAISMSYMARNLSMRPSDVFSMIATIADDLKDGQWDQSDLNNDGQPDDLKTEFALARTQLFQDTTTKLRNGELSDAQKEELSLMGFDVDSFENGITQSQNELNQSVQTYLNADNLPDLRLLPTLTDEDGNLTDDKATYTLTAYEDVNVTIEAPGTSWITPMWRYNRSPLPPIIRANRGDAMTLHFYNQLTHESTIHWHGFKIPADMDGGPDYPVEQNGGHFLYQFTMDQPAAPLWFHPHPDMQTGKQVYMGLAGVFILEDSIEKQLETNRQLPSGDKDVVLLVQDRRFEGDRNDSVRKLLYMDMEMDMNGMLGDTVLVNGSVMPKHEVGTAQYRYRIYNVSNARTYDFALSDGSEFTVVATDGGLLDKPVKTDHIMLGAAERAEIIIDFTRYQVGDKVMLVSRPFNGDMLGMMSGMNGNSNGMANGGMGGMGGNDGSGMGNNDAMGGMPGMEANGAGLAIMRFDVVRNEQDPVTLYTELPQGASIKQRLSEADVTNPNERVFVMSMGGMGNGGMGGMNGNGGNGMGNGGGMNGMSFVINGKTFDPTRVDEYVEANATEIWSIRNMSPTPHPFHAHAIQYQILSRNGKPASGVDLGWKDTFLVQPGETVRIIGKFEPINQGDYMYHCHILEHEDAGMMGYFRVGNTGHLDALNQQ